MPERTWIPMDGPLDILMTPVTVAQYQEFLDATQWRRPQEWPAHDRAMQSKLPASWVAHFDAFAFCHWLDTVEPHNHHFLPPTWLIQMAGRRPQTRRSPGAPISALDSRDAYPWGNEPDTRRCNCSEYRPRRPGPVNVDTFDDSGASPTGVLDLVGNLWEMSSTHAALDKTRPKFSPFFNYFDPEFGPINWLHAKSDWASTLRYVESHVVDTVFGWESQFDLVGGSYGSSVTACTLETVTWTAASNFGPFAGFRVARMPRHVVQELRR
jgi:hypothetical protein